MGGTTRSRVHNAPSRLIGRVAFVLIGVVLLGVGAWSAARAANDTTPDLPDRPRGNDALWNNALLVSAGAIAAALVIYVAPIFFRQGRGAKRFVDDERPEAPLWVRLLVGAAALLAVVGAFLLLTRSQPQNRNLFESAPTTTVQAEPQTPVEGKGAQGWAALGLFGAGAVAVVVALLWWHRRGRGGAVIDDFGDELELPETAGPIDLASLPPVDAIRAAYAASRRALASVGVAARAPETPYEYLDRVRRLAPPPSVRPIATLTRLFELARFSHHPLTPAMKQEAIAAHDAVIAEVAAVLSRVPS